MNETNLAIKRALISVSDKAGIVPFAKALHACGVEIISTGGTAKALGDAGIPVVDISSFTGFPEMMNGRVKTMHPKVMGGILGLRDAHKDVAEQHGIQWIDLVVCNLYPFAATIQKPGVTRDEAVENIDIGGPSMLRSAAKNMGWVAVVVDPADYTPLTEEVQHGGVSFLTRKRLATKAFGHTAEYDAMIHGYLNEDPFPEGLTHPYKKFYDLRYGENPHQNACVYREINNTDCNILNAKILQGKQLSFNNVGDADAALATLKEFSEPACVIVKHGNPCGAAIDTSIATAFTRAYNADSLSAFGGIIALNRPCTEAIAQTITKFFVEIVLAPSFEPGAVALFQKKQNMRVLELGPIPSLAPKQEWKYVDGGLLVQDADTKIITEQDIKIVTQTKPSPEEIRDLLFAWKVLKHIKSNAILIAKDHTTVGVGAGQVSRVDSVDIAIKKAGDTIAGSILASDAFFPFRDSIDKIAPTGIKAIIQPGGSVKDEEIIAACNEHGIAMVFTGIRCFKH